MKHLDVLCNLCQQYSHLDGLLGKTDDEDVTKFIITKMDEIQEKVDKLTGSNLELSGLSFNHK